MFDSAGKCTMMSTLTITNPAPVFNIVGNSGSGAGALTTINLSTYVPTGSNAYPVTIQLTDDGNYGNSIAIKQKTPGAMANAQITTLALSNAGLMTLTQPIAMNYTAVPTLASTQIGYNLAGTNQSTTNLSTSILTYQSVTLNAGVYILNGMITTNAITSAVGIGIYLYQTVPSISQIWSAYSVNSLTASTSAQLTYIINNSAANQVYWLAGSTISGSAT